MIQQMDRVHKLEYWVAISRRDVYRNMRAPTKQALDKRLTQLGFVKKVFEKKIIWCDMTGQAFEAPHKMEIEYEGRLDLIEKVLNPLFTEVFKEGT